MASTYTLNSTTYDGRYLQVVLTQTKDVANRRSKITGTVTTKAGASKWYATGPTTVTVGGTQRYTRARESSGNGQSNRDFVGTISEFYISHDSAGNASATVSISAAIYYSAQTATSGTWTLDSIGAEATACGAPTSCYWSPTVSENDTSIIWSGATGGTNNSITGYDLEYAESSDGLTWGEWISAGTITTTASSYTRAASAPSTRGYYKRVRVRTRGSAGASYYSAWKVTTNTVRKAMLPTAPTSCAVSSTLAEGNVTLSWSGAASGDGYAIASYDIQ